MPATKSIFALSEDLSGINDFLFDHLRALGWRVRVAAPPLPAVRTRLLAALAFHPAKSRWRRRYHRALERYRKGASGALWRSTQAARIIAQHAGPTDLVFQIGTLCLIPSLRPVMRPYAVFKDYTLAIARRRDPKGLPHQNRAWLDRLQDFELSSCRGARFVFTASEMTRQSIIDDYGVPPERVAAVGEGVKTVPLPSRPSPPSATTEILFVGKDFRRKGGPLLLEAFRRVRAAVPRARLTIVGPTDVALHEPGVECLGRVDDHDRLADIYRRATVFAMPSRSEPFGLVFLEAMAYGLPCIGTTVDAMPEIIVDGVTGFLVPPDDPERLAQRLEQLLVRRDESVRMGIAGYERVEKHFQWSHVARRIDAHLVQTLGA